MRLHVVCCRIRERRKLQIIESREKRKVEKPRLPRTAKKIQTKKMEAELGQIGLEIEHDEEVSVYFVVFGWFACSVAISVTIVFNGCLCVFASLWFCCCCPLPAVGP